MAHEQFSIYPCTFDSVTIADVMNVSPSPGVQKAMARPGGSIDFALAAEIARNPTARLSCMDLAQLANISPTTGLAVSSSAKLQFQKRADGGLFTSGTSHCRLTSVKGHLIPESIRARQDEQSPALLNLIYYALASGTTPPFAVNNSVSLTGSPSVNAIYKLGPVILNGSAVGGVLGSTVNFGLTYTPARADGNVSPTIGSITARQPSFEIELENLSIVNTIGMGLYDIGSGCTVYFQKAGAAPTDEVHIAVTLADGVAEVQEVPGQGEGNVVPRLMISGITGSSVLSVSTTATIS